MLCILICTHSCTAVQSKIAVSGAEGRLWYKSGTLFRNLEVGLGTYSRVNELLVHKHEQVNIDPIVRSGHTVSLIPRHTANDGKLGRACMGTRLTQ